MKKEIIYIEPISRFVSVANGLQRTEVEHYSDGTNSIVIAYYEKK